MLLWPTPHLLMFPWRIPKLCKYSTARRSPIAMLTRISQVSGAGSSCEEVRRTVVADRTKCCKTPVLLGDKGDVSLPRETPADLSQTFRRGRNCRSLSQGSNLFSRAVLHPRPAAGRGGRRLRGGRCLSQHRALAVAGTQRRSAFLTCLCPASSASARSGCVDISDCSL